MLITSLEDKTDNFIYSFSLNDNSQPSPFFFAKMDTDKEHWTSMEFFLLKYWKHCRRFQDKILKYL